MNAAADGYTLLMTGANNAVNATLYDNLKFDFLRDIAPVGLIMSVPLVMEVNLAVPVRSVPEFIAYAKANPGRINMASAGKRHRGPRVAGELFKMMTGVDMVHVLLSGHPARHDRSVRRPRAGHLRQHAGIDRRISGPVQACGRWR